MRPSNGARMVFFAMVARRFATVALDCLAFASAASRSACALASPRRSRSARCRLSLASDASATAAASCASSAEVSSLTSTAPRLTKLPDSNAISRTVPGSSAPRTTPRSATSDPIASVADSHSGGLDLGGGDGLRGRHEGLPRLHHADDLIGLHAHEDADDDDETDDDDDPLPGPALHERPRMKSGYATADAGPGDRAQERRDRAVLARLAAAPR